MSTLESGWRRLSHALRYRAGVGDAVLIITVAVVALVTLATGFDRDAATVVPYRADSLWLWVLTAASVAALMEGLGSAVVTNPLRDVQFADFVLMIGANPAQNHPVGATWIKNAVKKNGLKLVLADPRRTELARHSWKHLGFKSGTDVALLNALLHTIVFEGLTDPAYIEAHTLDFAQLKAHLVDFSPEAMAPVCGIDAATLREVARAYASAKNAMILWGMGISQHTHGTDNARCLIALALVTGQIGRPGTGLHPLRGQNNVQGASDAWSRTTSRPASAMSRSPTTRGSSASTPST